MKNEEFLPSVAKACAFSTLLLNQFPTDVLSGGEAFLAVLVSESPSTGNSQWLLLV
jgi:hypothetical protein